MNLSEYSEYKVFRISYDTAPMTFEPEWIRESEIVIAKNREEALFSKDPSLTGLMGVQIINIECTLIGDISYIVDEKLKKALSECRNAFNRYYEQNKFDWYHENDDGN